VRTADKPKDAREAATNAKCFSLYLPLLLPRFVRFREDSLFIQWCIALPVDEAGLSHNAASDCCFHEFKPFFKQRKERKGELDVRDGILNLALFHKALNGAGMLTKPRRLGTSNQRCSVSDFIGFPILRRPDRSANHSTRSF
jgi:hypothetical protein